MNPSAIPLTLRSATRTVVTPPIPPSRSLGDEPLPKHDRHRLRHFFARGRDRAGMRCERLADTTGRRDVDARTRSQHSADDRDRRDRNRKIIDSRFPSFLDRSRTRSFVGCRLALLRRSLDLRGILRRGVVAPGRGGGPVRLGPGLPACAPTDVCPRPPEPLGASCTVLSAEATSRTPGRCACRTTLPPCRRLPELARAPSTARAVSAPSARESAHQPERARRSVPRRCPRESSIAAVVARSDRESTALA